MKESNKESHCEITKALITSIASLLVAFVLGGATILSTIKSNDNSIVLQEKSNKEQFKQIQDNFEKNLKLINEERRKEISINIEKNKLKDKKNKLRSARIMIATISSTMNDLESILKLLEVEYPKPISENIFFYNEASRFNLESSINILNSNKFYPQIDKISYVPTNTVKDYINFHKKVNKMILLVKQLMNEKILSEKVKYDRTMINLLENIYKISEKDLLKMKFDIYNLNIKIFINTIRIITIDTILTGYNVIQEIEKICDDKSILNNKLYYDELKKKLGVIENETNELQKQLLLKTKPLFNLSIDQFYNFYLKNQAEQSH